MRPSPPAALLDLHFSLRCSRRVNNDHTIDFEGHNFEVASTLRKTVTLVHHPRRQFWVLEHPPMSGAKVCRSECRSEGQSLLLTLFSLLDKGEGSVHTRRIGRRSVAFAAENAPIIATFAVASI